MKMAFFWSASFSDSWRHQFVCHPKWSDLLDGQRDADTDLQWPRGNGGRQHTGTLTSHVLYWDVFQSYHGLQYTGKSFSLLYEVVQTDQGLQYTGKSFSLLYEVVQADQGLQYTGETFSLLYEVVQSDQGFEYTSKFFLSVVV